MPKATDLMKSTAHAQQAELAGLVGAVASAPAAVDTASASRIAELEVALKDSIAKQAELGAQLTAEQEAHAKTQAALAAAVTTPEVAPETPAQ